MEKRDTVSFAFWVPLAVAEKVNTLKGESQCDKYRTLLIQAMKKYMEQPGTIPLHMLQEEVQRRRVAIPITISRTDYEQLDKLSQATGLSKKKLGEILICGEVI